MRGAQRSGRAWRACVSAAGMRRPRAKGAAPTAVAGDGTERRVDLSQPQTGRHFASPWGMMGLRGPHASPRLGPWFYLSPNGTGQIAEFSDSQPMAEWGGAEDAGRRGGDAVRMRGRRAEPCLRGSERTKVTKLNPCLVPRTRNHTRRRSKVIRAEPRVIDTPRTAGV